MSQEEYIKHSEKLVNLQEELLSLPNVNKAAATILCSDVEKHVNLLIAEKIDVDLIGNKTEELVGIINDFFKSLDKNNDKVFNVLIEFRHLVGHINVSLINKFNITNKEEQQMNTQDTTKDNNTQEEILEEVKDAKSDLKDALKDAKEAGDTAKQSCGEYWDMTNIAIAGTTALLLTGAAAFAGYRYGYAAGQEECPVIINVGSME